jgi:Fe-S cluster assembly iron-binding protein IscA
VTVEVTPQARELIARSLELARHDPAEVGVRLRLVGDEVMPRFAPAPEATDEVVETEGVRVFVDARILAIAPDVVIAVSEEHERLVVRPKD